MVVDRRRLTTIPTKYYKMAKDKKINMPSSGAGLTRYFDDYKTNIEFKPEHVVIMAIVIILIVLFLHMQGI